jgi:hypothetical protein
MLVAWSGKVAMLLQLPQEDLKQLLATQELLATYRAQTSGLQVQVAQLQGFFVLADSSSLAGQQELRFVTRALQGGRRLPELRPRAPRRAPGAAALQRGSVAPQCTPKVRRRPGPPRRRAGRGADAAAG